MKIASRLFTSLTCLTLLASTNGVSRAQEKAGDFLIKIEPTAYNSVVAKSIASSINSIIELEKIVFRSLENNELALVCKLQVFSTFRSYHREQDGIQSLISLLSNVPSDKGSSSTVIATINQATIKLDKELRLMDRYCA